MTPIPLSRGSRWDYWIGVAVSSSCILRFVVASSDEKIVVGFLIGTTTFELHLVLRTKGGAFEAGSVPVTTLLMSAVTLRLNWF